MPHNDGQEVVPRTVLVTIDERGRPLERAREMLRGLGELDMQQGLARTELLERIPTYDALVTGGSDDCDREFFRRATRLKIISVNGAGYDNVDVESATDHGVLVTNTPGVMAESVAEHAIALMLACTKKLLDMDRRTRQGEWLWDQYWGDELWGKTLGQIGLGSIGALIAKKAQAAFNMTVLVYDPFVAFQKALDVGACCVPLDELLARADIVSISTPLTDETYHLIGERELGLMKRTAKVINTARGSVVDEQALITALQSKRLGGAGLDVFECEPIPRGNPLLDMANVVLTPHKGAATLEAFERMLLTAIQNIVDAFSGRVPRFLLNTDLLSKPQSPLQAP